MSKSITEKELAETLREECDINRHNGWNHAARKIAEAMGVELAPEKPEPGTWHVVADGPYVNRAAYVNGYSSLLIFADNGDYDGLLHDGDWPTLTPARVAPAEPVELSDGALVREWNEAMDAEADTDLRWERVTGWAFMGKGDQAVLRRFAHNLLAKHGHGQDATNLRSEVERLQNKLREAEQTLVELRPAEPALPDPLNEEQVGELWDKVTDSRVADWIDCRDPLRVAVKRTMNAARMVTAAPVELSESEVGALWDTHISNDDWGTWGTLGREFARIYATLVNAALANHGHGRVKVSRDEVYRAISTRTLYRPGHWDSAADAVMELLEASK